MNYNNNSKTHKLLLWFIMVIVFSCTTLITVHSQTQPNTTTNTDSDSFVLACGATTAATDANNRKWSSDSKFITPSNNNISLSATAQFQDPSLPSTIPYMTARVFKSETTYKFPVSPEFRHWVRLHFYPSPYDNNTYDPSNSFFSVMSNGFTLLNNFSASITAEAFTQAYLIREFTMSETRSGDLELTFAPANNSFAFINGIEIIPMPDIFRSVPFVEFSMQTMFRLNVGGQYITATTNGSDRLSRIWYDDSPYVYGAAFGVTNHADSNVTIAYPTKESENIAPLDVYGTGRSMGPNATVNVNYNLTWVFEVDVNFTYLVRFHFCDYRFEKVNQMVFMIFINNHTAEKEADVIAWSGGKGVPVYKDYATYVSGKNNDGLLWIALHPNVAVKPEFYDSILNGLEIYKVNDTRGNLAGLNPEPSLTRGDAESQQGKMIHHSKKHKEGVIVGAVLGALAGIGLIAGLIIAFLDQIKKTTNNRSSASSSGRYWLPIYGSSRSSGTTNSTSKGSGSSSRISNLSKGHCRHFTLHEIRLSTDNFSESRVIGIGGFGKVYKGIIDGKTTTVAIKRANPLSEQGMHEFLNEIDLLSKLRHRHLVSLIGACDDNGEMILVYDYMANGTLREHLYKTEKNHPILSWGQRLGICIGAARGIHYLHTGAKHTIIHRDVKSTNILLDEQWVAKVSDFGLSKTGHNMNQTHFSTVVKGSFGYLDPEYFKRQQLTDKSDVYSFGVVLFEVLCGRPALSTNLPREQANLSDWAILNCNKNNLEKIIDPCIVNEIHPECLSQFIETAMKCLSEIGINRPSMGEVLWNLEYCLQLQNNPDGPKLVAQQRASDACGLYADAPSLVSIEEESEKSEEIEDHSEISTSLEIVNPVVGR